MNGWRIAGVPKRDENLRVDINSALGVRQIGVGDGPASAAARNKAHLRERGKRIPQHIAADAKRRREVTLVWQLVGHAGLCVVLNHVDDG